MSTSNSRPHFLRSISATSSSSNLGLKSQRDKPRLYIALYPRGGSSSSFQQSTNCDSYHWSLIAGPKSASRKDSGGTRYHIAHHHHHLTPSPLHGTQNWIYEEQDISSSPVAQDTVLVRVTVAKILDEDRVRIILRANPIRESDTAFNCLSWVRRGVLSLLDDGRCLKSYVDQDDWDAIESRARKYCKRKRELRRFTDHEGPWNSENVSTFNFWENRETVP